MDDLEVLLSSLIDLTEASHELAPPIQHQFLSRDAMYRLDAQYASDRTSALLRYLLGYVLEREPVNTENIDIDISLAIHTLLSSGFEFLDEHKPPPQRIIDPNIVTNVINGISVVLADNIPKPARFSCNERENPVGLELEKVPKFQVNIHELNDRNVIFVDDIEFLDKVCSLISSEPVLYVSVEYHRVHTYRPFPCVISILAGTKIYVIDALKLRSCSGLRLMFANPMIVKVIYDANYVLPMLWECLLINTSCVYDPLMALQLLDINKSYDEVLSMHSIKIKKLLFDWRIRPLDQRFIRAAANKVWKLPFIAQVSQKEVDEKMIVSVMRNMIDYTFKPYKFDSERCISELVERFPILNGQAVAVATELVKWRNSVAFEEDESPNMILPDRTLVALSLKCPTSPSEISDIPDIVVTPIMQSYCCDIVQVIRHVV